MGHQSNSHGMSQLIMAVLLLPTTALGSRTSMKVTKPNGLWLHHLPCALSTMLNPSPNHMPTDSESVHVILLVFLASLKLMNQFWLLHHSVFQINQPMSSPPML